MFRSFSNVPSIFLGLLPQTLSPTSRRKVDVVVVVVVGVIVGVDVDVDTLFVGETFHFNRLEVKVQKCSRAQQQRLVFIISNQQFFNLHSTSIMIQKD